MARRNPNPNQRDELLVAGTALAAIGVVGYGCYKLFGSLFGEAQKNQPISADQEGMPESIPFRMNSRHPFPKDSKTYVVNTIEECRYAMRELKSHCDEYSVLGFDCEWVTRPGFSSRKKVALLQLASHRGLCVLVRLSELKHIPPELAEILRDKSVLKVGIMPITDAQYLSEDFFRESVGTLDLRFVAKMARCDYAMGLARMSEKYLRVPIDKNPNIRCSNWEDVYLSDAQISYATLDALVAVKLFEFFGEKIARQTCRRMQKVVDDCFEYADMSFTGQ